MKHIISYVTLLLFSVPIFAQRPEIIDNRLHTLQVIVNQDPLLPPIIALNSDQYVDISFDEFTHEYHRYIYKVEHCDAQWQPSSEIFESDFLEGFNGQPIEDYEKSFNTTVLYTHYNLRIPNEYISLKLSGNYKVTIYNDEDNEPRPVAVACFCITEPGTSISATVSSNTDIDFNNSHQQVSFDINYGAMRVIDPIRELKTVVIQNRRTDNMVFNPRPNIQTRNQLQYTHNRDLVFPAGNEYHKFEVLDVHQPSLNVDRIEWHDPHYHAILFQNTTARSYVYDEDQNGAFIIRNADDYDVETTCEYLFVHFALRSPQIPGGEVYVNGQWTYNRFTPTNKLTYNQQSGAYEGSMLLKQGYYSYNYLFVPNGSGTGTTTKTDGNFYETENEYMILVYHRPTGGRYDRLVGYRRINFKN